jgi:hypothetical protein
MSGFDAEHDHQSNQEIHRSKPPVKVKMPERRCSRCPHCSYVLRWCRVKQEPIPDDERCPPMTVTVGGLGVDCRDQTPARRSGHRGAS